MMDSIVPKTSTVFKTLFKADMAILMSNKRSAMISLSVPMIILLTWKPFIRISGGPFVLATALTIGIIAIGLMGYTLTVARDRDKGIFQRLRVAPVSTWLIMASRISIQLIMIMVLTLIVFVVGARYDGIVLSLGAYITTFFIAIFSGALYLSLGQFIVGLIKNFDTINATTRLTYVAFILIGTMGELMVKDPQLKEVVRYSPYGTVKIMLTGAMEPDKWARDTNIAVAVTLAYIIVFASIGIRNFKWTTK